MSVYIINACGEWNEHLKIFSDNSIKFINLNFNYSNFFQRKVTLKVGYHIF